MPAPEETKKKQILVVDDERLVAADLQQRLERMGYSVPAPAHSGMDAIRRARSSPFDLVLMDIHLDGEVDGIAAAQALRAAGDAPVVYLTAYADDATVQRAQLTQPLGYILKPISDDHLRTTVRISIHKHEMERRLRASEAWLSTTLRSVGEGIIATKVGGEIVFMNPVAEQLTGWTAGQANGRPLLDVLALFPEPARGAAAAPILDLRVGEDRDCALVSLAGLKTTVGVTCFENRSAEELLGAVLVIRDLRARKELEGRLMQVERMEAIASMAGGLAHDFNNQLTVILGYAHELSSQLSGEQREEVLEIQNAASIANSVTGQLLTLSRRDAARTEPLNVNELICEVQPLIANALGKTRSLTTDLSSPPGYIHGDRHQLKQALLNLAIYARQSMPAGGEMRIETSVLEIDSASGEAGLCRPGHYVVLRVADSGDGLDRATLGRIFEPFQAAWKTGAGSGLGLSLVHSIVMQNGGYITANSEHGSGTSFEILLPAIADFQSVPESATIAVQ